MRYSIEPRERRYVDMVFCLLLEILMMNMINL